jgi:hydrogenase nickel insertion protein HypA
VHELAITNAVLETVLRHAAKNHAAVVSRVLLVVSELSDLHPVWIQRYFTDLASGTIAASARLEIERQAPEFTCNACRRMFALSLAGIDFVRCPVCGNRDCRLMSGADYVVEEIEVGW